MKAAELYEKTLRSYSTELPVLKISLSSYCKNHHVNYRGLCHWMQENSISVPKSSPPPLKPAQPVSSFSPITILSTEVSGKQPSFSSSTGIIKGVQILCPNGFQVSIREISGKVMTCLIDQLNPRWDHVCIDFQYDLLLMLTLYWYAIPQILYTICGTFSRTNIFIVRNIRQFTNRYRKNALRNREEKIRWLIVFAESARFSFGAMKRKKR